MAAMGPLFKWQAESPDAGAAEQFTAGSIFPGASPYFDPSPAPLVVDYIVDDLSLTAG